ncbi:MAG: GNAT family N-acetyltransferase [Acidimicrobiales bacterium]
MTVGFRRLERDDFPSLSWWFSRPHVKAWWSEEADLASIEGRYGPAVDGTDPTEVFVVEVDGQPAGMAQRYRLEDNANWEASLEPSGRHEHAVGIDYLIGDDKLVGIGLGPVVIERFVAATWEHYPGVREVVVAVQQGNRPSWRALEKAGFERTWAGTIVSDDPGDAGPSYVYVKQRP